MWYRTATWSAKRSDWHINVKRCSLFSVIIRFIAHREKKESTVCESEKRKKSKTTFRVFKIIRIIQMITDLHPISKLKSIWLICAYPHTRIAYTDTRKRARASIYLYTYATVNTAATTNKSTHPPTFDIFYFVLDWMLSLQFFKRRATTKCHQIITITVIC